MPNSANSVVASLKRKTVKSIRIRLILVIIGLMLIFQIAEYYFTFNLISGIQTDMPRRFFASHELFHENSQTCDYFEKSFMGIKPYFNNIIQSDFRVKDVFVFDENCNELFSSVDIDLGENPYFAKKGDPRSLRFTKSPSERYDEYRKILVKSSKRISDNPNNENYNKFKDYYVYLLIDPRSTAYADKARENLIIFYIIMLLISVLSTMALIYYIDGQITTFYKTANKNISGITEVL